MTCPCGRVLEYSQCCEPLHQRNKTADTAEDLMRSRFSAFYLGNVDYLIETHASNTRDDDLHTGIIDTLEHSRFTQLNVLETVEGGQNQSTGKVSFVAWYKNKESGELLQLAEKSNFVKDAATNQWLYVDGVSISPSKPGRNDNCPCGSGKKFKRCCA